MLSSMTGSAESTAWPLLGLGCSPIDPGGAPRDLAPIIDQALDLGYTLFDTAELYGTEGAIGQALARRNVARGDVVVGSKLWSTHHRPHLVEQACERSLQRLGLAELDLLLIHTPQAWRLRDHAPRLLDVEAMQHHARYGGDGGRFVHDDVPLAETWGALEALRRRGLVRAIGVSNFACEHLHALFAADGTPRINQIARSPLAPRSDVVELCQQHGIVVMAHSPLGAPDLLTDPTISAIANAHGRTPAQVILRWNIEQGIVPLPGTRQRQHLAENWQALGFRLSSRDMSTMDRCQRPVLSD
jgi:alcohol dehydrogenase (NADP+)